MRFGRILQGEPRQPIVSLFKINHPKDNRGILSYKSYARTAIGRIWTSGTVVRGLIKPWRSMFAVGCPVR